MLKLLERNITAIEQRLILLAPSGTNAPSVFTNVHVDPLLHRRLVREMQAVRGSIYFSEGNIKEHQLNNGLHSTPEDERSWHLLMTDRNGQVTSCAWYLEHENTTTIQNLRVRNCPLASCDEWREPLFKAVESEIARARTSGLRYAEVGGWAVAKERRCTSEGLVLALAAYGLCRRLGGAIGITTANVSHASSSILRRLGGSYLSHNDTAMPAYFDPKYDTKIELLRFDSRNPDTKYAGMIDLLRERLVKVPVVAPSVQSVAQPLAA